MVFNTDIGLAGLLIRQRGDGSATSIFALDENRLIGLPTRTEAIVEVFCEPDYRRSANRRSPLLEKAVYVFTPDGDTSFTRRDFMRTRSGALVWRLCP